MEKHFDPKLVGTVLAYAIAEYEHYKVFGADILNGLDLAVYDVFGDEENEPEGLYEYCEEILVAMYREE